jgi:hypothetical protein
MPTIPVRNFGKHGDQISVLGLGGHHLGDSDDTIWETLEKLRERGLVRYYGIALGPAINAED